MDFVNRLKHFMDTRGLSISQFADTCKIPRPTMSQILNGRNKKVSDELIAKIHAAYPELSVLWLMFGEGSMELVENIGFSGAQNDAFRQKSTQYSSDAQQNSSANNDIGSLFQNFTDNSADGGLPIPGKTTPNIPVQGDNTGTNTNEEIIPSVADAQQYYVHTHELIEFDSDEQPSPSLRGTERTANPPLAKTESATPEHTTKDKEIPPRDNSNNISLTPKPGKTITNILVFYSDNSFQSFHPSTV